VFWLSHHHPDEFDRCYDFGGIKVCARCLGTYPVLFAGIAAQFALGAPLQLPLELPLAVLAVAPALADWALGRFEPHRYSNLWRSATGILLGLGLSRSLYVHLQRPFPLMLLAQLALVTAVATPVILKTYRRGGQR
jgi:uncharacterized membrane protein